MKDPIVKIIPVEKDKRIKVIKHWDGLNWVYRVLPQKKILLWWGTSSWSDGNGLFMLIRNYYTEDSALVYAEEIKSNYLEND